MYELVIVRGKKYSKDDHRCPKHPHQPGGPLVHDPRHDVKAQEYIGWKRVQYPMIDAPHPDPVQARAGVMVKVQDIPKDELGRVFIGIDAVKEGDAIRMERNPISFYWKYDSTPVTVELTPQIRRAIEREEIERVTKDAAPKETGKGKGEK